MENNNTFEDPFMESLDYLGYDECSEKQRFILYDVTKSEKTSKKGNTYISYMIEVKKDPKLSSLLVGNLLGKDLRNLARSFGKDMQQWKLKEITIQAVKTGEYFDWIIEEAS